MMQFGYQPPTAANPTRNLPNTRIESNRRGPAPEGMGEIYMIDFKGPRNELLNEMEVKAAAKAWMSKENLTGFMFDYPLGRVESMSVYDEEGNPKQSFKRTITLRHPGI